MNAKEIIERHNKQVSVRASEDILLKEAARFSMPQIEDLFLDPTNSTNGEDLSVRRFQDSTVKFCLKLASSIYSWQFPEGTQWCQLEPLTYEHGKMENVVRWYSECSDKTIDFVMNSNFPKKMMTTLHSYSGIGNGCISVELKDGRLFFRNHPISNIFWEEDADGEKRTVSKVLSYTAEQAYQMFGDSAGENVLKARDANDLSSKFKFIHFVTPRFSYNEKKKDSKNLPYASYYVNVEEGKIVKEDGYYSQVYFICTYWEFPGNILGRGPGTECLATSRMFDAASRGAVEAIEKSNNPPLVVEDDAIFGQPSIEPNSVITYRAGSQPPTPMNLGADVQGSFQFVEYLKNELGESFFSDIWNVFGGHRNMSATEASIRDSERLGQVAPNIKSLERELLDPLFTRCFDLLLEQGDVFPPPPEELMEKVGEDTYKLNAQFKIHYAGKLSMATSAIKADQTFMFIDRLAQLAQVQPDIIAKYFNLDQTVPDLAKNSGVPIRYIKTQEQIQAQNEAQAQQQQQMAEMQQLREGGIAAKDITQAMKNAGS